MTSFTLPSANLCDLRASAVNLLFRFFLGGSNVIVSANLPRSRPSMTIPTTRRHPPAGPLHTTALPVSPADIDICDMPASRLPADNAYGNFAFFALSISVLVTRHSSLVTPNKKPLSQWRRVLILKAKS